MDYDVKDESTREKLRSLTKGELRVFNLMITGVKNKAIAETFFIHEKTVKFHITRVYKKMGVKTRVELIFLIVEKPEKIEPPPPLPPVLAPVFDPAAPPELIRGYSKNSESK